MILQTGYDMKLRIHRSCKVLNSQKNFFPARSVFKVKNSQVQTWQAAVQHISLSPFFVPMSGSGVPTLHIPSSSWIIGELSYVKGSKFTVFPELRYMDHLLYTMPHQLDSILVHGSFWCSRPWLNSEVFYGTLKTSDPSANSII